MIKSICILLSIVAVLDYEVWQIGVRTTFLNENLDEIIYIVPPERFMERKQEHKLFSLQRSIYRLNQASRLWNIRFD